MLIQCQENFESKSKKLFLFFYRKIYKVKTTRQIFKKKGGGGNDMDEEEWD